MIRGLVAAARRYLAGPSSWERYRDYVRVHPGAIVDPSASVRIFNPPSPPRICLEIGEGCHVYSAFSILRPQATIRIGARCQLGNSHFVCAERIDVDDDVIMSWGITIVDSDNHSLYWSERQLDVERCRRDYVATRGEDLARSHDWSGVGIAPVRIGAKSWIGMHALVLKGVHVGEGAVVGAGSVVTRSIAPWHAAAGNPCRELRPLARERAG